MFNQDSENLQPRMKTWCLASATETSWNQDISKDHKNRVARLQQSNSINKSANPLNRKEQSECIKHPGMRRGSRLNAEISLVKACNYHIKSVPGQMYCRLASTFHDLQDFGSENRQALERT
jgi:hypothetical protein